jgi:osmotically-inducible protein OsmY
MMQKGPNRNITLLGGVGIGAALMYLFDPKRGARRRHMVADQMSSAARTGQEQLRKAAETAKNHAWGTVLELRGRLLEAARGSKVPDDILLARVRAALGHHARHAGAIEVAVRNRMVTLQGPVRREEIDEVVRATANVRGVQGVNNQLAIC